MYRSNRTKKRGGAPQVKKSFKACKKFKIKGSNEANMSKCTCIDTDISKLFNTRLFKCEATRGLRLKTEEEVDEDEDDEDEQKYLKEVITYIKSQQEEVKLKSKKVVDKQLERIFKKYENVENNFADNVNSIYDYLLMMHVKTTETSRNDLLSGNNAMSSLSPSERRHNLISTGIKTQNLDDIEGMDSFTRLRIEKQQLLKKKDITQK